MLSQLLTQTCTITRRLASNQLDAYGNEVPEEETFDSPCLLQWYQGDEASDEGETSTGRYRLFLPAGTEVTTADVGTVNGKQYELYGDPAEVVNPRTQAVSHLEATVIRIAGAEDPS